MKFGVFEKALGSVATTLALPVSQALPNLEAIEASTWEINCADGKD